MLTHMLVSASSSIASTGMAIAESVRIDLDAMYLKYIAQDMKFAKDGAKLMTDNQWLEQPPTVLKHKDLVGIKQ